MPKARVFFTGFVKVAQDEDCHFSMLATLASSSLLATSWDLLASFTIEHCVHEGTSPPRGGLVPTLHEWLEPTQPRRSAWSRGVHLATSRWPCSAYGDVGSTSPPRGGLVLPVLEPSRSDLLAWNGWQIRIRLIDEENIVPIAEDDDVHLLDVDNIEAVMAYANEGNGLHVEDDVWNAAVARLGSGNTQPVWGYVGPQTENPGEQGHLEVARWTPRLHRQNKATSRWRGGPHGSKQISVVELAQAIHAVSGPGHLEVARDTNRNLVVIGKTNADNDNGADDDDADNAEESEGEEFEQETG
ncbi:hypothetical protein GQ457_17G019340 [Hibiscus cannabinus]